MEVNEHLRNSIMEIIDNQLKANDPQETKQTFDRLQKEGLSEFDTRQYIGQCVCVELYDVIKNQKPFNEKRYIKNLHNLPKEPFE